MGDITRIGPRVTGKKTDNTQVTVTELLEFILDDIKNGVIKPTAIHVLLADSVEGPDDPQTFTTYRAQLPVDLEHSLLSASLFKLEMRRYGYE